MDDEPRIADGDWSVGENLGPETGVVFQKFLCAGRKGDVHPFARRAMLRAAEFHSLNFEIAPDEREKIDIGDDDVAAQNAGRFVSDSKFVAELFENFGREKCDLAFVIFLMVEVAIAEQAFAGDAVDSLFFDQRRISRFLPVMADEVVLGRDENLADNHNAG